MSKLRSVKGVMREADVLFDGIELAKGWFEKALTQDRHAIHTLLRESCCNDCIKKIQLWYDTPEKL